MMDINSELALAKVLNDLQELFGTTETRVGIYNTDETGAMVSFLLLNENLFNVHTEEETYKILYEFTENYEGYMRFLDIKRSGIYFMWEVSNEAA